MNSKEQIDKWNKDRSYFGHEVLFISQLRNKGLTDDQIVLVLDVVDEICTHCWDGWSNCQCTNDE